MGAQPLTNREKLQIAIFHQAVATPHKKTKLPIRVALEKKVSLRVNGGAKVVLPHFW